MLGIFKLKIWGIVSKPRWAFLSLTEPWVVLGTGRKKGMRGLWGWKIFSNFISRKQLVWTKLVWTIGMTR